MHKPLCRGRKVRFSQDQEGWVTFWYERLSIFCHWCGVLNHDSKDCDDKLDELKGVGDGSRLASSGACCTTGCVVRLCCGYNGLNHGFLQSTSLWAFKYTLSRSLKFMTFPSVGSLSSIESQIKSILRSRLSVIV